MGETRETVKEKRKRRWRKKKKRLEKEEQEREEAVMRGSIGIALIVSAGGTTRKIGPLITVAVAATNLRMQRRKRK